MTLTSRLHSLIGLRAEVGRSRTALEEAGEDGLDQGAEDDLCATVTTSQPR